MNAASILIVEDNELNRDVLCRRLRRRGFATCIATDGQDAIDQAQSQSPDLVLMDMNLPIKDGWTATAELRAKGFSQPIVALTAHATPEDRDRCLEAGCNDFATKPIDLPQLLDIIERRLKEARDS